MERNEQMDFWEGDFGNEYTARNDGDWDAFYKSEWGVTRTELNKEFVGALKKDARILEVGCNRAHQLRILQTQGFSQLWGLEINKQALALARKEGAFNIVEASAFDIPFKDGFFDVVFTSGVLIHISPKNLHKAFDEMHRVSKEYIWCFEYFSEKEAAIEYRGNTDRLWKNNFCKLFMERFPDLELVKERKIKYLRNDNVDQMFLLRKKKGGRT